MLSSTTSCRLYLISPMGRDPIKNAWTDLVTL